MLTLSNPTGMERSIMAQGKGAMPELIYAHDLARDEIIWNDDASKLIGRQGPISTGGDFAKLIEGEGRVAQLKVAGGVDAGLGVPFQLRYSLTTPKGERLLVDDRGRWFADEAGAPWLLHGSIRIVAVLDAAPETSVPQAEPLTGLQPRASLRLHLAAALPKARAKGKGIGLILAGLSDLSKINGSYGCTIADELISGVAGRLKSAMRKKDMLLRFSGAKFAILLSECNPGEIEVASKRFVNAISKTPIASTRGPIVVDLRIGGAISTSEMRDPVDLIEQAEEALREARESIASSIVIYAPSVTKMVERARNLAASDRIISGLNERRIMLAYQPIADAREGIIAYHEGLVRLKMSDGRIVGADELVPVAEKIGILKMIDHRVIELALEHLSIDPMARLAVNVAVPSALQPGWMEMLTSGLKIAPESAERLTVEITETAMIADIAVAEKLIRDIKSLGPKVAIDDFGSGHTSFKALRQLPVDLVKIDGSFVRNLKESEDDRFFVKTLVDLAHHLGMKTTAEFVIDAKTAEIACSLGIDYLQGEFIGEPEIVDYSLAAGFSISHAA
jgi:diguanylate cyclase (GGDEF)-like protein